MKSSCRSTLSVRTARLVAPCVSLISDVRIHFARSGKTSLRCTYPARESSRLVGARRSNAHCDICRGPGRQLWDDELDRAVRAHDDLPADDLPHRLPQSLQEERRVTSATRLLHCDETVLRQTTRDTKRPLFVQLHRRRADAGGLRSCLRDALTCERVHRHVVLVVGHVACGQRVNDDVGRPAVHTR